jgi:hypothetical protein
MIPVYKHGESAYVVLRQKPIHYFAPKLEEQPDMQHVQQYMQWCGADHVLRTQTHFMFCETVPDIDFETSE